MTREEFIQILNDKGYSYKIEGDKIIVTQNGHVNLGPLETIPSGVHFNNLGEISLGSLKTLPPGVEFNNVGHVNLAYLKTISSGVKFNNKGDVFLNYLETIPPGVEFNNRGGVVLFQLIKEYAWFNEWNGNIRGIAPNTLLNRMIEIGLFL